MSLQTCLITGATGGLGHEFARLLAADYEALLLVGRNNNKLLEIRAELTHLFPQTQIHIYAADLSQEQVAYDIMLYAQAQELNIVCLINNAGFGDFGSFVESNLDKQIQMVKVNCVALMQFSYLVGKKMAERGCGSILNVASIAAFEPGPLMSVYYASKAFVLNFSEALHVELKRYGVHVAALCPGPVATGFEDAANLKESKLFESQRVATAAEVASYAVQKLMAGRTIIVPGMIPKLAATFVRVFPRALVRNFVYHMQGTRSKRDE